MKTPEHERLLRDVLHEESYGAFRESVRDMALGELRRRRARQRTPWLAMAASLMLGVCVYWIIYSTSRVPGAATGLDIVRSVPLRKEQVVMTAGHTAVASVRSSQGELTTSIAVIRSRNGSSSDMITDEQLLAFFKDQPVALVSLQDGTKTLILLSHEGDPSEQMQP